MGKLGSYVTKFPYQHMETKVSLFWFMIIWLGEIPHIFAAHFLELRLNLHFFYSTSINEALPKVIVNRLDTTKKLSRPKSNSQSKRRLWRPTSL